MNRLTHSELLPLVQPMYYSYPKCQAAYEVPNQFLFGTQLMVAPITGPQDPYVRMGKVTAWLPKGDWFDFFTGLHYYSQRGRKMNLYRNLDAMPVFARAGAIVPMAQYGDNRLANVETMEVTVFPGANGSFTLYEDAGDYSDYEKGAFANTHMELKWGESPVFTIAAAVGDLSLIPGKRTWSINLRGFHKDAAVSVNLPGAVIRRLKQNNTTQITVTADVTQEIVISVNGEALIHDNSDVMERCREIILFSQIGNKDELMGYVRSDASIHSKLWRMEGSRREWIPVSDALREMLTLTEEEF